MPRWAAGEAGLLQTPRRPPYGGRPGSDNNYDRLTTCETLPIHALDLAPGSLLGRSRIRADRRRREDPTLPRHVLPVLSGREVEDLLGIHVQLAVVVHDASRVEAAGAHGVG